jgi:hypothetical protein
MTTTPPRSKSKSPFACDRGETWTAYLMMPPRFYRRDPDGRGPTRVQLTVPVRKTSATSMRTDPRTAALSGAIRRRFDRWHTSRSSSAVLRNSI